MQLRLVAIAAMIVVPQAVLAVGDEDDAPPVPTQTTTECPEGTVFDADADACVVIQDSGLDDDGLYDAARELAYARRYDDALAALAAMSDPDASRVQNYLGFIHRQLGDMPRAMAHYAAALEANPDNLLARAYRGMAFLESGEIYLAQTELAEIRARGGRGTWPDRALSQAIRTGNSIDY